MLGHVRALNTQIAYFPNRNPPYSFVIRHHLLKCVDFDYCFAKIIDGTFCELSGSCRKIRLCFECLHRDGAYAAEKDLSEEMFKGFQKAPMVKGIFTMCFRECTFSECMHLGGGGGGYPICIRVCTRLVAKWKAHLRRASRILVS